MFNKIIHGDKASLIMGLIIAAVVSISTSCGLGILSEMKYSIAIEGPPNLIVDGFEQNDSKISTKYDYQLVKSSDWAATNKTLVSTSWSSGGDYSLYLDGQGMTIEVDLQAESRLSYVVGCTTYSSYSDDNVTILRAIDGVDYESVDRRVEISADPDTWYNYVYTVSMVLPAGTHVLTLASPDDYYSLYVDDLSIGQYITNESSMYPLAFLANKAALFDWDDYSGASSYSFRAATDADFEHIVAEGSALSSSSYTIPPSVSWAKLYWSYGINGVSTETLWSEPGVVNRAYSGEAETFSFVSSSSEPSRWIIGAEYPSSYDVAYSYSGHGDGSCLKMTKNNYDPGYVETRVYLENAGSISLYYYTSYSSDTYRFYIDGNAQATLGSSTWTQRTASLGAGYHTLRFEATYAYSSLYLDDLVVP